MIGVRCTAVMAATWLAAYVSASARADVSCVRMYSSKLATSTLIALVAGAADTAAEDYAWGTFSAIPYIAFAFLFLLAWVVLHRDAGISDYARQLLEQSSIEKNKAKQLLAGTPNLPGGVRVFAEHVRNTRNEEIMYLQRNY